MDTNKSLMWGSIILIGASASGAFLLAQGQPPVPPDPYWTGGPDHPTPGVLHSETWHMDGFCGDENQDVPHNGVAMGAKFRIQREGVNLFLIPVSGLTWTQQGNPDAKFQMMGGAGNHTYIIEHVRIPDLVGSHLHRLTLEGMPLGEGADSICVTIRDEATGGEEHGGDVHFTN